MDEQSIFLQALEEPAGEERAAWLDEVCGTESRLRRRVDALLRRHEQANVFLERPAPELEATLVPDAAGGERSEGPTRAPAEAFVTAGATASVLKSIGLGLASVPHVSLRDAPGEDHDPIVRPNSPEVPQRDADSRYRLDGAIARGGMGAILKGRDTDLGRELAVKVLLDSHKDQPEMIQRFIEEAQIGGQLQHPGIAPVYELGQFADRRPFFTMKLVKGKTLSALLSERETPDKDRARFLGIFEQVCQTMAYAHSRGVIHRDLKPANIMVGAFGEVQVMDWGLAKVLAEGGVADERKAHTKHKEVSVIQTRRSEGSETAARFGSQTQMGSVMGTPAYMPPEQALGEIDQLDARSDVFALGAILCEILTGQPPYVADDGTQVFRMASRGKLDTCFERLDACEVDAELVRLTRDCLEVEPHDRPRDAGVVAQRMSGYLESVEARLRETEMERAAQAARAEEERKRRRVTLALAASVMLLIAVSGGGWMWMQQQQAERRSAATSKVTDALQDAQLHERLAEADGDAEARLRKLRQAKSSADIALDLARQEEIEDAVRQDAKRLAAGLQRRIATVRRQAEQARADRSFREELESIRLGQADTVDVLTYSGEDLSDVSQLVFDTASADQRYEEAFRKAGLDVLTLDVPDAAERIRESAIREAIIGALDNWSRSLPERTPADSQNDAKSPTTTAAGRRAKLRAVVEQSDSNAWRKSLRTALDSKDVRKFKKLVESEETRGQPPALLAWLGAALREAGEVEMSIRVLREAQFHHPGDFWLNYELCTSLRENGESLKAVGFARALVAVRPESSGARWALADALDDAGRDYEAERVLQQLLPKLSKQNAPALLDMFAAMSSEQVEKRITDLRRYVERQPDDGHAQRDLGLVLAYAGRLDEALAQFRKVIEVEPESARHYAWGLKYLGKLDGVVALCREAIEAHPKDTQARVILAEALCEQDDPVGAVAAFRKATEIEPKNARFHFYLGKALAEQGKHEEALTACRRAVEFSPDYYLGRLWVAGLLAHPDIDDLKGAIAEYRKTIELFPKDPSVHILLANALALDGEVDQAIAEWRLAIELDPEREAGAWDWAIEKTLRKLREQGKPDEAVAVYRFAREFHLRVGNANRRFLDAYEQTGDVEASETTSN